METTTRTTQAIIIGGGIAGCALALFMKKEGIDVAIYEAYPYERTCGEGTVGGGLQIAPNGMHVLDRLGLADHLMKVGVPSHKMAFHDQTGKVLVEAPLDSYHSFRHPAVNMKRSMLHHALVTEVEKQKIPFHFEKKLASIDEIEGDGLVIARFEDGTEASADFLVGADGAHSRVRAALFHNNDFNKSEEEELEFLGLMTNGGFVHTDLFDGAPEEEQGAIRFFLGPGGRMFAYCRPSADDPKLVMWWRNMFVGFGGQDKPEGEESDDLLNNWKGRFPTREELQAIDQDKLKERILEIPGGWLSDAHDLVNSTDRILTGTIHTSRSLPHWYKGRVVLVGDAAHAVSPHSGQGASQALEDSLYLSQVMRIAYLHNKDNKDNKDNTTLSVKECEEAFQVYQDGRKERAEMVVKEGKSRGEPRRKLGEKAPGAVGQWFNNNIVKFIFKVFVPGGLRSLFDWHVDWLADCRTLGEVRKRQKEQEAKAKGGSSVLWTFTLATVAVATLVAVVYTKGGFTSNQ